MTARNHSTATLHRVTTQARARIAAHVARAGLNRSRTREAVIDTFLATPGHVSAEELTALVRERAPGVGQTTVYRALKLLVDCGVAATRQFGGGQTRYERVVEGEHHDHLVCRGCGKVIEFEYEAIEVLQRELAARYGFTLEGHLHQLIGRCAACREVQHS
jgi:Fur family ferric uptake transcriptional regulator